MRILLIDDDPIVRECVETITERSNDSLLVASELERGLLLATDNPYIDIALLGVESGDCVMSEPVRRFHGEHEEIALVALATTDQERLVLQTLDAGATGFINKAASTNSLLQALQVVLRGGFYVPASVLKARGLYNTKFSPLRGSRSGEMEAAPNYQDSELIRLMLLGRSSLTIARQLGIGEGFVRNRISAFLKEFSVTNRSEAILVLAAVRTANSAGRRIT